MFLSRKFLIGRTWPGGFSDPACHSANDSYVLSITVALIWHGHMPPCFGNTNRNLLIRGFTMYDKTDICNKINAFNYTWDTLHVILPIEITTLKNYHYEICKIIPCFISNVFIFKLSRKSGIETLSFGLFVCAKILPT